MKNSAKRDGRYWVSDYEFINALRAFLRLAPIAKTTEVETTTADARRVETNPRELYLNP